MRGRIKIKLDMDSRHLVVRPSLLLWKWYQPRFRYQLGRPVTIDLKIYLILNRMIKFTILYHWYLLAEVVERWDFLGFLDCYPKIQNLEITKSIGGPVLLLRLSLCSRQLLDRSLLFSLSLRSEQLVDHSHFLASRFAWGNLKNEFFHNHVSIFELLFVWAFL